MTKSKKVHVTTRYYTPFRPYYVHIQKTACYFIISLIKSIQNMGLNYK